MSRVDLIKDNNDDLSAKSQEEVFFGSDSDTQEGESDSISNFRAPDFILARRQTLTPSQALLAFSVRSDTMQLTSSLFEKNNLFSSSQRRNRKNSLALASPEHDESFAVYDSTGTPRMPIELNTPEYLEFLQQEEKKCIELKHFNEGGEGKLFRGHFVISDEETRIVVLKALNDKEKNFDIHQSLTSQHQTSSDHNILKLIKVIEIQDVKYAVLPFCEFFLNDVINFMKNSNQSLNPIIECSVITHWLQDALEAVSYMHGLGFVHSDLKPDNFGFKLGDDISHWCVIDFDSTKTKASFDDANRVSRLLRCNVGVNITPRYMSPLYFSNEEKRNFNTLKRCDTYALGAIILEALQRDNDVLLPTFLSNNIYAAREWHGNQYEVEKAEYEKKYNALKSELNAIFEEQNAFMKMRGLSGIYMQPVTRFHIKEDAPLEEKMKIMLEELQVLKEHQQLNPKLNEKLIILQGRFPKTLQQTIEELPQRSGKIKDIKEKLFVIGVCLTRCFNQATIEEAAQAIKCINNSLIEMSNLDEPQWVEQLHFFYRRFLQPDRQHIMSPLSEVSPRNSSLFRISSASISGSRSLNTSESWSVGDTPSPKAPFNTDIN